MNSNSLVTIITVCYNSALTINKTIESVLNQTYKNIEYIIIDGNSTDETMNIINNYKSAFGNRLTIISEADNGIYDAMNKGIRHAHGEVIGIINSDDFYEANAVEIVINSIGENELVIVYGALRKLKNGMEESVIHYSHKFLSERMIAHPSCFISASVYSKYGLYNTKYKSAADYEFMLRIYEENDIVFVPVYEILSNFSLGGMSSTLEGYRDLIRLLYDKGKISGFKYYILNIKTILKNIVRKFNKGKLLC